MKDKVAIVTGATKGMGFAISKKLLSLGSKVVLVYREDEKRAEECKRIFQGYSNDTLFIKADISCLKNHGLIIDKTLEKFSKINILINNAGVAATESFMKMTESQYEKILSVNLKAPLFLAQKVAKEMIKQEEGGSIINFSSISGHRGTGGVSYDVAKAGIIRGTQTMATALGPYNIRVNSISPGLHKTEMNRYHWENDTKVYRGMKAVTALGRGAEASEITGTVVYLASEASSFVTGSDILVDGGYLAHCPGRS